MLLAHAVHFRLALVDLDAQLLDYLLIVFALAARHVLIVLLRIVLAVSARFTVAAVTG